jgi:hypothetical protein
MEHPHILPFLGISQEVLEPQLSLVSPWMANGNVLSYIENHDDVDRLSLVGIHTYLSTTNEPTIPHSGHSMFTRDPVPSRTQTRAYPRRH